ncbi:MAG: isochorismate synthase [Hormoscilla sp. SP12CHS1]|nr:isochorismate synthase [Hormoscilla sp. SP12CHS1]
MRVTSEQGNIFSEPKVLENFLLGCQETAIAKDSTMIVSISQEIPLVDPLAVMAAIAPSDRLQFYWESAGDAIAAIDAATSIKITQADRFRKAQEFIHTCLANTISIGDLDLRFAGPHFFCSFTFFGQQSESVFPAATVFLPRLQVACSANHCILVTNLAIGPLADIKSICSKLWWDWHKISLCNNNGFHKAAGNKLPTGQLSDYCVPPLRLAILGDTEDKFKQTVGEALELIRSERLSKIVIAHGISIQAKVPFREREALHNLRQLHGDCHIFMVSNGEGKSFIGATPERLMRIRCVPDSGMSALCPPSSDPSAPEGYSFGTENQQLFTEALAGSAPRGKTRREDADFANSLLASEKERREHQFVIDYIKGCLSKLDLKPEILPMPKLRKLANIQHLWTPIEALLPPGVHPLSILAALHPTPAVAGTPREIACQEIPRYESFDRGLYAAPLGWVDGRGNSEFVVGIRSALIEGDRATVYAGAGIVAGSDPEKELAEIQLKFQALLQALV